MQQGLDPHVFHAYDIRGTVGDQLTPDSVRVIARAFGTQFRQAHERPVLVVGRDLRASSQEFAAVAMEALRATGCDVIDVGECPTPVVYFAIGQWGAHGGLGITASHNPSKYNGYKVYWAYGGQVAPEQAAAIYGEIQNVPMFGPRTMDYDAALASGEIALVGKEED
jgi:phosphomannomutase/phosphoglucomutase